MVSRGTRSARPIAVIVCVLSCVAAVLTGCAQIVDGSGGGTLVRNANLPVRGDSDDSFDTEAKNALSDVMAFWKKAYPSVADGAALPPLKGALYSVDGLDVLRTRKVPASAKSNKCLQRMTLFIVDNAAYCSLDDSILWDRSPDHLVPLLAEKYGSAVTALVFAHEFGHAIQARLKLPDSTPTIDAESQADCAAGAFIGAAMKGQAPHFQLTPAKVDEALDGFLQIRDSTPESPEDISHGNGFDRLNALQQGITRGVTYCYGSTFFTDRTFTERGYTDQDIQTGGNEPLADVLAPTGLVADLNRFWTTAGTSVHHTFAKVTLREADHPKCDSEGTLSEFGYCPDTNTVYYSTRFANQAYYSLTALDINRSTGNLTLKHNQPADFALGMMLAIAWGMAARHQFFQGSIDDKAGLLAGICYAGAYADDINLQDPTPSHPFVLSAPDMDEATSAVLSLVELNRAFGARDTSGLQRVTTFVTGYDKGLHGC